MPGLRFVVITGLSGAGKTATMHALEDAGFFCVDNLPPALIPKFAELCVQSGGSVQRIAVVCDIRGGGFFNSLSAALDQLPALGIAYEILFLEASDEVLVRRFKESRRPHPLSGTMGILEGIRHERVQLAQLREAAHHVIDTSRMSPKELWREVTALFSDGPRRMVVHVTSFGFKRGLPLDADLVFDVRFLPNPYYEEPLREIDGTHPDVQAYVFKWPVTQHFVAALIRFIEYQLPLFESEGRSMLHIALGCTGGQHRSVAIAEHLGAHLVQLGYAVRTIHRDAVTAVPAQRGATT